MMRWLIMTENAEMLDNPDRAFTVADSLTCWHGGSNHRRVDCADAACGHGRVSFSSAPLTSAVATRLFCFDGEGTEHGSTLGRRNAGALAWWSPFE